MNRQCPDCPDGQVWTANGPTGKACPTCHGKAYLGPEDDDDGDTGEDCNVEDSYAR